MNAALATNATTKTVTARIASSFCRNTSPIHLWTRSLVSRTRGSVNHMGTTIGLLACLLACLLLGCASSASRQRHADYQAKQARAELLLATETPADLPTCLAQANLFYKQCSIYELDGRQVTVSDSFLIACNSQRQADIAECAATYPRPESPTGNVLVTPRATDLSI